MCQNEPNLTADSILLNQLQLGDKKAFDILFDRYWEKTFSEAYKRVKEHDASKDIVQEIFIHLWINRETIHIQNLPAYLHIAVRNRAIKYFTRQKLNHPFFNLLETLPEKEFPCRYRFALERIFLFIRKSSECFTTKTATYFPAPLPGRSAYKSYLRATRRYQENRAKPIR